MGSERAAAASGVAKAAIWEPTALLERGAHHLKTQIKWSQLWPTACAPAHLADVWGYGLAPHTHAPAVNVVAVLSEVQASNNNTLLRRNHCTYDRRRAQHEMRWAAHCSFGTPKPATDCKMSDSSCNTNATKSDQFRVHAEVTQHTASPDAVGQRLLLC
jgi:hypothetical protein